MPKPQRNLKKSESPLSSLFKTSPLTKCIICDGKGYAPITEQNLKIISLVIRVAIELHNKHDKTTKPHNSNRRNTTKN